MIIRLPLLKQKGRPTCGPVSLRMILHILGNKISQAELEKIINYKEGKGTSTIKLALAAKKLGFDTELKSIHITPQKETLELEYYKKNGDESIESLTKLVEEAKKAGVKLTEKSLNITELSTLLNKKLTPIVLLDWNIIKREPQRGFLGHYIVLCGFDNKFVYVNNSAGKNGRRLQAIPRRVFDKARKSLGTDEDILIISKSNK
jgi:ABC-type bacteriocin/lantibiotic exporter with double-glycine peptidase domain